MNTDTVAISTVATNYCTTVVLPFIAVNYKQMSTEFDSKGFSAVSSFFGDQGLKEETAQDIKPTPKKRNRSGLGAKETFNDNGLDALESAETRKKILSIGKKRKKDDDSDAEVDSSDQSDEEDQGRTSIKKKEKKLSSAATDVTALVDEAQVKKPKKKKKKGKKERMAEKESQEIVENQMKTDDPSGTEQGMVAENEGEAEAEAVEPKQGDEANNHEGNASLDHAGKKNKKRKIRSKQKNIKKDTRPSSEKPDHLKVGSKSFAGRPMTKETREFMNLPESRTITIGRERAKVKHARFGQENENFDQGGLAIDDLLAEPVVAVKKDTPDSGELLIENVQEVEERPAIAPKKKKKAPKKKSKFKNLK